jgi:hypothetical protein
MNSMSQIKSRFKRWTGSAWVEYYFKTSADLIDETASYKVMTSAERDAIGTYLTNGFNVATKLVQINAADAAQDPSKIDRSLIGDLSGTYLTVSNPTFTGTLTGNKFVSTRNVNELGFPLTTAQDLKIQNGSYADGNLFANIDGSSITLTKDTINFRLQDLQAGSMNTGPAGFIDFYRDLDITADYGDAFLDFNLTTRIKGLQSPLTDDEAATKLYVDALVAEGVKPIAPVKAATVPGSALIPPHSGLKTIDGISLAAGDRVLVKDATAGNKGIYVVAVGTWTLVEEDSLKGSLVFVEGGTVNNDSKWYAQTSWFSSPSGSWVLFSKTDTITASGGLQKVGLDISVASLGITDAMLAGEITLAKLANFTSLDNAGASYDTWGELTSADTSENIDIKLKNLYASIGLLRGTANYNTNNTETIAGAFDLAEVKNRTYVGATHATPTAEQLSTTLVTGDLYFFELAPEA